MIRCSHHYEPGDIGVAGLRLLDPPPRDQPSHAVSDDINPLRPGLQLYPLDLRVQVSRVCGDTLECVIDPGEVLHNLHIVFAAQSGFQITCISGKARHKQDRPSHPDPGLFGCDGDPGFILCSDRDAVGVVRLVDGILPDLPVPVDDNIVVVRLYHPEV